MSKIKLFTNPLDASSLLEYEVETGVALIDWLQHHYPDGFQGSLRVFVGQDEIDLSDLDYRIKELDQVTMLVMPAGVETITTALIYAAISFGVGLLINLLFPPPKPGDSGGDESPVYSLSPTRNEARLGSPIPSRYGTTTFPPDIAAAPYLFNSYIDQGNDQFVDTLLCLGQGRFDVEEVYIGDTPVSQMEKGTVYYYKTGAGGHYRTMGAFAEIINRKLANTGAPYPFHENVYTSPELESFEFSDEWSDPQDPGGAITGDIIAEYEDPDTGRIYGAQIKDVDSTLVVGPGDTIQLAGTTSNDGSHYISAVIPNEHFDDLKTLFIRQTDADQVVVDEPNMTGTYSFPSVKKNMTAGPYRAQPLGQTVTEINCDFAFPQGLFRLSESGNARKRTIDFEITYQEIDPDTGVPIGVPTVNAHAFTSRMRSPLRFTVPSGPLTPGAYLVSVERLTNDADAADIADLMVWTSIKGSLSYDPGWVYGYVTLMMVRMRATHGLASAARQRIRVKARRILESDAVDSSNPIEVIRDIWTSARYGLGRNESELSGELETLAQEWASGPYFNGVFDQKSTGWDAMSLVASMTGSKLIQDGGLLTVVPDRVQSVRTALFSSANIVRGSFNLTYNFDTDAEYDSIQLEYRDPELFTVAYAYHPPDIDLDEITPNTLSLFGSTDEAYASQMANYYWNVQTKRRKEVQFQTEMEGLIPRFGDRIGVSHPMPNWSQSGVIVEVIDAVTFRVDQDLNWESDNIVVLRNTLGEPSQSYTVTMGGPDVIVFDTAPTETISVGDGMEPTHYVFGRSWELVQDFLVSNIVPQEGNLVTITGQTYDETIFDGAPPHMGGTP